MGKTRYNRAKDFLEALKKEKGEKLPFPSFLFEAKKYLGADEKRITRPYIRLMLDYDLITSEGENVRIN